MKRIVNSKQYSFGMTVLKLVEEFIKDNSSRCEPTILIGIENGGCEFIWGDPKSRFYSIKLYENYVVLETPRANKKVRDVGSVKNHLKNIAKRWC